MKILGLRWLGVATREYEPMVRLLRDVMRLRVEFEDTTTIELSTQSGDRVQVFAPEDPYFERFFRHASGPVALFEVEDVEAARRELEAAGIEVLGAIDHDMSWEWIDFRGPDGNVYELASRRPSPRA